MRNALLASVAVLAVLSGSDSAARAQIFGGVVVHDPGAIAQLLESVGIEGSQLDQLVATYNQVVGVYNQTTNVWHAVEGVAGAAEWAPGLRTQLAMNPLPYAASDHPGWVGGFNDPSVIPFGAQYLGQNTVGGDPNVYNDGTFAGGEILKSIRSYSSIMGVANNHMLSIETRLGALGDLFNQLDALPKLFETGQLQARLSSELNYANAQNAQATQTMSAITMQKAVFESNQRQWQYQDEINGLAAVCTTAASAAADAGSAIVIPACAGVAAGGGDPSSTIDIVSATRTTFIPGTSNPIAPGG